MAQSSFFQLGFKGAVYANVSEGLGVVLRDFEKWWADQPQIVAGSMLEYLNHVSKILVDRNSTPWPGGTTDTSLSLRTGGGVRSILRSVKVEGTTWETIKGSIGGSPRLLIHETGGIINSNGKLLTVPLPAALNARGLQIRRARNWPNTFTKVSRAGNLIIFQRRAGNIIPLYVLKTSVKIRPRLGMQRELEEQTSYWLERASDMVMRDFTQQLES